MADAGEKMILRNNKKPNILNTAIQSPTMNAAPTTMSSTDSKIKNLSEVIMKKLGDMEKRFIARIDAIAHDINSIRTEVSGAMDKLDNVDRRVSDAIEKLDNADKRVTAVVSELDELRSRVRSLENDVVSSDLVVHGVPNDAVVGSLMKNALAAFKCSSVTVRDAFRVGQGSDGRSRPLIVKLASPNDRVVFLKSLATFRKTAKRCPQLSDVGISGSGKLLFYESLTLENRKILQKSLSYKRENRLHSVFSLRGCVFVRAQPNTEARKIPAMCDLEAIVGGL